MKKILTLLLDFLFPTHCVGCHTSGAYLCETCLSKAEVSLRETNDPSRTGGAEAGDVISLFNYRDKNIKKALWGLKYSNKVEVAKILAGVLYDRILEELADRKLFDNFVDPLLIPIPLSKKSLRKRGFNQVELIAREIVTLDNNNSFTLDTNVLYKIKDTKNQMSIKDKQERLTNLRGAFDIKNKEKIEQKNIILLDDIQTTGATLNEAKKVLKNAGARNIISFTIAH